MDPAEYRLKAMQCRRDAEKAFGTVRDELFQEASRWDAMADRLESQIQMTAKLDKPKES